MSDIDVNKMLNELMDLPSGGNFKAYLRRMMGGLEKELTKKEIEMMHKAYSTMKKHSWATFCYENIYLPRTKKLYEAPDKEDENHKVIREDVDDEPLINNNEIKLQKTPFDGDKIEYWSNKNIMPLMQFPFFRMSPTISSDPSKNNFIYEDKKGNRIEILPSGQGWPTHLDAKLLALTSGALVAAMKKYNTFASAISFSPIDIISRKYPDRKNFGGNEFQELIQSLKRMAGCQVITNIRHPREDFYWSLLNRHHNFDAAEIDINDTSQILGGDLEGQIEESLVSEVSYTDHPSSDPDLEEEVFGLDENGEIQYNNMRVIERFSYVKKPGSDTITKITIHYSKWALPYILEKQFLLTVSKDYLSISSSLKKWLYDYCYKIANLKKNRAGQWYWVSIPIKEIYERSGSDVSFKHFHEKVKNLTLVKKGEDPVEICNLKFKYDQAKKAVSVQRFNPKN